MRKEFACSNPTLGVDERSSSPCIFRPLEGVVDVLVDPISFFNRPELDHLTYYTNTGENAASLIG